ETPTAGWTPSNTCGPDTNIAVIVVAGCVNDTCTFTNTLRHTPPCNTPFAVAMDSSNVSCHGGSNGTVSVTPQGGVPAYTYMWSNGSTNASQSGLKAGQYCVTVFDSQGCSGTGCTTVNQPDTLTASITGSNVTCHGGSDGSVTSTVSGGTPAYTYNWS